MLPEYPLDPRIDSGKFLPPRPIPRVRLKSRAMRMNHLGLGFLSVGQRLYLVREPSPPARQEHLEQTESCAGLHEYSVGDWYFPAYLGSEQGSPTGRLEPRLAPNLSCVVQPQFRHQLAGTRHTNHSAPS